MAIAKYRKTIRYKIHLVPEKEGGFTIMVPSLPGCITYGRNITEAKQMAADAIKAYIASLKKHNEPIPSDEDSLIGTIELPLPSRTHINA